MTDSGDRRPPARSEAALTEAAATAGAPADARAAHEPVAETADTPAPSGSHALGSRPDQEPMPADDELAMMRVAALADDRNPFGQRGRPLRRSPFVIGFLGTLGGLTAFVLGRALSDITSVLVLVIVALYLAIGLNPIVEALERRNMRRSFAIATVFFAFVALIALFVVAIVPPLVSQTSDFVTSLPDQLNRLTSNPRIAALNDRYDIVSRFQGFVTSGRLYTNLFGGILGVVGAVFGALFGAFTVIVLTLYFMGSLSSIERFALRLVPASRRPRVTLIADEILGRIGGYVAGQIGIALIAGVTSYVFMLVAHVPYALPLAMIVAFLDLVPQVGATLGGVVLTIVGLLDSLPVGIACLIFVIAYQQVENYVIYPRVMRKTVDVAPAVTIIAALIGGSLLGIVGALLAIPTAAAIRIVVDEVVVPRQDDH